MAPGDGLGLHDDGDVGPTKAAESGPEQSVQPVQRWPWPFTLEQVKLLVGGEDPREPR